MTDDYDGADVFDASGDKLGHVERSYIDDSNAVQLVEVKLGSLLGKHRLVPVDSANLTKVGLMLPFTRDAIENSPDAKSAGDTVSGEIYEEVRTYYDELGTGGSSHTPVVPMSTEVDAADEPGAVPAAGNAADGEDTSAARTAEAPVPQAVETEGPAFGQLRTDGDVVEIPIVEERLVKQRVVSHVLRVRKTRETDVQNVTDQVRKESVEADRIGDAPVQGEEVQTVDS